MAFNTGSFRKDKSKAVNVHTVFGGKNTHFERAVK